MTTTIEELAPCGIFCGACPSFGAPCRGCSSDEPGQGGCNKQECPVRICCYQNEKVSFCGECGQFPCAIIREKHIDARPGEPACRYRHEIPENFATMKELGLDGYLARERRRWSCPDCGGRVHFFYYKCSKCGKIVNV